MTHVLEVLDFIKLHIREILYRYPPFFFIVYKYIYYLKKKTKEKQKTLLPPTV